MTNIEIMKNSNELVSIITPVKNDTTYLEGCLENVLNQNYTNIEHILIDGGSTDGTLEIIKKYQAKYPDRIRFVSEPDNGVGDALNKGLKMARGTIWGWLDTDAYYEPGAIDTVVQFFSRDPDACVVFGEANEIKENGEYVGRHLIRDFDIKEAIRDVVYIPLFSIFYRKRVVDEIGPLNDLGNDYEFWIRVGKHFKVHRIADVLSTNRLRKDGVFYSRKSDKRAVRKQRYHEDFTVSRQNGAGRLSPAAHKYYRFLIMDALGIYPFVAYHLRVRPRLFAWVIKTTRALRVG